MKRGGAVIKAIFAAALIMAATSCSRAPEDMVLVTAGEFTMGSDSSGEPDERPAKKISLKDFYIDKYEVTNENYKRFVTETKHPEPRDWASYGYNSVKKDFPVTFVTYEDAEKYCSWAKKRLPTEEEWEKAARGTDGRTYPWGNEFRKDAANTSLSGLVGVTKAGSYEAGKSPYGAYDMSGNAWEWTSSSFDAKSRVVRGGSWGMTHRFATTFFRIGYPMKTTINNLGFRCAKSK